jgi:hypothetical protein
MFHEYALDPRVISSWDRARFFLDAFGPWKGRFLAEYPRRWKKMVYDGLTCLDVERQRVIERLSQFDPRVFSPRADSPYDGNHDWLVNAEAEHRRQPFHAIVASEPSAQPHILNGATLDERHELWRVETGRLVSREPAVFTQMLRLLLLASRQLVLIDPYFRSDHDAKTRPLVAFCQATSKAVQLQVHFADFPLGYAACMFEAERHLPERLPIERKVTLHCWKQRAGGPRLHNRYLLTEVGGVKFGDGIEVGGTGQQDHLSILDEPSRATLWDQYVGPAPAFESAGIPRSFEGDPKRRLR